MIDGEVIIFLRGLEGVAPKILTHRDIKGDFVKLVSRDNINTYVIDGETPDSDFKAMVATGKTFWVISKVNGKWVATCSKEAKVCVPA